jgi:uncharacterized integral membrane protein (TIGR00698 family)
VTWLNLDGARRIAPGLMITVLVAMAAQFISDHYGAPVMLMAILLGIPLHFLTEDQKTGDGVAFASRHVLRFGVALLGLRVSFDMVGAIGWGAIAWIAAAVAITILLSLVIAPWFGKSRLFGFLSGGSVAICGASAALAISSILPKSDEREQDLAFTVIAVTVLSTVAMIAYPILADRLGLDTQQSGLFLGGTIHDVAQVVGAGYSISDEAGDVSTIVKLLRVTLLAPVVFIGALILRNAVDAGDHRPPLIPGFVAVFLALAVLNSYQLIPQTILDGASVVSRSALVVAVAAVGMKTSLEKLKFVGGKAIMLLVTQTVFIGGFVLLAIV